MKEKTHLGNRLLSVLLTFLMLLSLLPSAALAADTQQIALMAVTQNGFLIEPEYVTYHSGDTVKDVLKKAATPSAASTADTLPLSMTPPTTSASITTRMDTSWISRRIGLTAIWFTTNSDQSHGSKPPEAGGQHGGLQHRYQRPEGLQGRSGGLADDAAVKGFDAATGTPRPRP